MNKLDAYQKSADGRYGSLAEYLSGLCLSAYRDHSLLGYKNIPTAHALTMQEAVSTCHDRIVAAEYGITNYGESLEVGVYVHIVTTVSEMLDKVDLLFLQ
jgi:hypothetical protein